MVLRPKLRRAPIQQEENVRDYLEDIWKTIDQQAVWVRHAEAKALASLAGQGALASLLVAALRDTQLIRWADVVGLAAAALSLLAGSLTAAAVVTPRFRVRGQSTPTPDDLIYYRDVADAPRRGSERYATELVNLTGDPARLARALGRQAYGLALVADRKSRLSAWAVRLIMTSGLLVMVSITLART